MSASKNQHFHLPPIYGEVLDNEDPLNSGRLKIRILGINDDSTPDFLEWVEMEGHQITNQHDPATIGEQVEVIIYPHAVYRWRHLDFKDKALINELGDDYLKSLVLMYRNLTRYGLDGRIALHWSATEGLRLLMQDSGLQIRTEDGSALLFSPDKLIHVLRDHISLGSEGESAEPALLGDKTEDTLVEINTRIKALHDRVAEYLTQAAAVAGGNPFTAPLAPIMTQFSLQLRTDGVTAEQIIQQKIDLIKSQVVSLD